jgi:1-deoxy-D-xylulose-5-phosphate synthase
LVGADGPTHHGAYDLAYLRVFPNMVVMAPGDEEDIAPMFKFALRHTSPVAIRYPRANLDAIEREVQPVELGQAEILEWETDGVLLACGAMLGRCLQAAGRLRERHGLRLGVINARFVKPLDFPTITKAIEECGFVLTVEEGSLMGGFGSAVLEAASEAGLPTSHVRRLGLPDRYILHAERDEQLTEVGLDLDGIAQAALSQAIAVGWSPSELGTDRQLKAALASSAARGSHRGIMAGNEPSCAR